MLAKRIIPCLDVKDGKTVKGINFLGLKEVGDPVEMGIRYSEEGADELVYLDVSATLEGRGIFRNMVSSVAKNINIPFTVGGGVSSLEDASELLLAGADKISINSAAVKSPDLIYQIAKRYGSQFIVVAIDAKLIDGKWRVVTHSGTIETKFELFSWAKLVEELGAGEILFTSMDHDGTEQGYASNTLKQLTNSLSIPVIASGGAGRMEHFVELFANNCADGALASSVFHYGKININELKKLLKLNKIEIRL
ncbi:MAG TPA: imidazole glycerol phosphate synthase subunit HisF [Bacteroidales bacterium]|nr:imidazole glycerol phosphate synthase subunit HisF [Bacteroidales bacterium]